MKVLPGQVEEAPEGESSKMPMQPACSLQAGNAVILRICWPRQAAELFKALSAGGKPIDLGSWLKLIGKGDSKRGSKGQRKPGQRGSTGRFIPCRQASEGEFGLTMDASSW